MEDKLELLFNNLIDNVVENVYIEDDAFVMEFVDGTLVELYSSDGDLDMYFEMPEEHPPVH